jgi:hypothetical protein
MPGQTTQMFPFFSIIIPTINRPVQRTHCFQSLGGFGMFFRRPGAEDREFCERWLRHGFRMTYISRAL